MAQTPKNIPLFNIDSIGKPNIGTQETLKDKGSHWEMAVAVPLKNRKFERGTLLEYQVSIDPFDRNNIDQGDTQFGISAPIKNTGNTPSHFIQYGDKALLGPSSDPGFMNYSEHIRIASSGEVLESITRWRKGTLYSLDRSNKFSYAAGDGITIYGTGCGDNWVPQQNNLLTLGIQKGVSSLNRYGKYEPGIGQVSSFESVTALAFSLMLPVHSGYTSHIDHGSGSRSWGQLGLIPWRSPDVFDKDAYDWFYEEGPFSGIFRFLLSKNTNDEARVVYTSDSDTELEEYQVRLESGFNTFLTREDQSFYASIGDLLSSGTSTSRLYLFNPMFRGVFGPPPDVVPITITDGTTEVEIDPDNTSATHWSTRPTELAQVVVDAINGVAGFSLSAAIEDSNNYPVSIKLTNKLMESSPSINFDNKVDAPIILGFNHPGGENSHFAQALFSLANVNNPISTGFHENIGVFSQIIKPLSQKYPAIIGDTHYRMGINWKGSIKPAGATNANLDGTELFAAFKWNPLVNEGDIDHYGNSMMSTSALLSKDKRAQNSWQTNIVNSFVDQINLDSLGDIETHKFDIVLKTKASTGYTDTSNGQGIEMMVFVDQVWLEHQGDVSGASNGFVEIEHYPNQDTLAINRRNIREPEVITLANGQQFNIQTVSTGEKKLYEIDADFLNVPLTIYNQFRDLLRWQDKGYKLTLHPYLPGVPHCLVGRMEISNEQKNHWDLTRYTFHFKFFEQD